MTQKILAVFISFFALKALEVKQWINLQLTGKISPKLDSNSSLLLE